MAGFSNQTGHSFASFLLGAVQRASTDVPTLTSHHNQNQFAFYFSDDWKVTPKLTLNMGLRWEVIPGFTESTNRQSTLDLNTPNPGADGRLGALVFIDDIPGNSFTDTNWVQLAPRFGFAYRVTDKLVVRGGYGINNLSALRNDRGFDFATFGFDSEIVVSAGTGPTGFTDDPAIFLDDPFPRFEGVLPNKDPAQGLFGTRTFVPRDSTRLPYVQNWNLTVQHELPGSTVLEVAYMGNKGTRLNARGRDTRNQLPFSALALGDVLRDPVRLHPEFKPYDSFPENRTVAQALKPFPQFGNVRQAYNYEGISNYHALQVTVTRHLTSDLSYLLAYTFSKATGNTDTAKGGSSAQDIFNRGSDKSVAAFNVPQFLKLTWVYQLPFGPGKRFGAGGALGKVVGGWRITAIQNYRSGDALSISQSGVSNVLGAPGIRPDVTGGPQEVSNSGIDIVNGTQFLDPAGFAKVPTTGQGVPLRAGTAPRFLPNVRGPHKFTEDFGISKMTTIREDLNVEFRVDITNIFNRHTRGNPNTRITSPDFGKLFGSGAFGDDFPRRFQLQLRVNF